MASIVAEILSSAGKLERNELGTKIGSLGRRIADLKSQVQDKVRVRYDEFMPVCLQTLELTSKFDSYTNELESITNLVENELIPEMQESSDALRDARRQLATAIEALKVINRLIEIHETLESSQSNFDNKNFVEALESLEKVDSLTLDLLTSWGDGDGNNEIRALKGLKTECIVRREKLIHDSNEIWNEFIVWQIKNENNFVEVSGVDVDSSMAKETILTIVAAKQSTRSPEQVAWALQRLGSFEPKLKAFSNRFIKHVIVPVLTKMTDIGTNFESIDGDDKVTLKIKISTCTGRPSPLDVFSRLLLVIDFIEKSFGSTSVADSFSLMRQFGDKICNDFYDLLIKECLAPAVPSRREQLGDFSRIIEAVTQLQKRLLDIGMADDLDNNIVTYARNVDALFANKMCKQILTDARELMVSELHEAINPPDVHQKVKSSPGSTGLLIDQNILRFPACKISKSTYELVRKLYSVMEEATTSSPLCARRLFVTTRNAVELYFDVVPTHHRNRLETLPQQAALFHNNCMYIAHHLRTLGHQFQGRLPLQSCDKIATFVDLIPIIRDLGTQIFLDQMRRQQRQLLATLNDHFQLNDHRMSNGIVTMELERAVKSCLLQLQHLKAVWKDVLPIKVFNRALGTLVNSMIEDIVWRVIAIEDLPAATSNNMIAIFSIVKDQCPGLFIVIDNDDDSNERRQIEIQRLVSKWSKFVELLVVLAAPLVDLVDRWSEGKGPLAHEFTVDEVKRLIRALFQNTDRRAAALSRIK